MKSTFARCAYALLLCALPVACSTNSSQNGPTDGTQSSGLDGNGNGATAPLPSNNNSVLDPNTTTSSTPISGDAGIVVAPLPTVLAPYTGELAGPDKAYMLVGRFDGSNPNVLRFSLANSKLGATFTGSSLSVSLADSGVDRYAIQIDALPPAIITTAPSPTPTVYPIATNLSADVHTVWLVKITEFNEQNQEDPNFRTGVGSFYGFGLAPGGALGKPPLPRPNLIVTIGDSGFTGYGADAPDSNCKFAPRTQNALKSVPAKLAATLDAEVINVSGSGKGIAASAYDPGNDNNQLPALWLKAVPPSSAPPYSFPPLPVRVVVLQGGSDDLVGDYGSGVLASASVFVAKYTALLADIRSRYPAAIIVGTITPNAIKTDKSNLTAVIGQAVQARNAAGDANVYAFNYFSADPLGPQDYASAAAVSALGFGCQGHTSEKGAIYLADKLAAFVRSKVATP